MWFLYYHFSGILCVMLLKIHTLSFALSYYNHYSIKKVYSEPVLSYIIYKKLMPPTTTVRVGVGGKIMAAVFYVLWAIKNDDALPGAFH